VCFASDPKATDEVFEPQGHLAATCARAKLGLLNAERGALRRTEPIRWSDANGGALGIRFQSFCTGTTVDLCM